VGQKEIDMLMENSPDNVKRSNLFFLGTETDRLGQKTSSLLVWNNYVSQNELTPQETLEILIRVAQLQYDIGNYKQASLDFDRAISSWKKKGCNGEGCDDLRVRLRNFVTVWNKAIKRNPTLPLLRAYQSFVSLFNTDVEMMYWGGDVARFIDRPGDAMNLYYQTSITAAELINKGSDKKDLKKIFEGSLLAQIEMAEATKNAANRKKAYDHYLALNPNGANALEVKYQLAHLLYEAAQYDSAASAFKTVAFVKDEKQRPLRIKAADLSLDSLALGKKDEVIESWSPEFAKLLPERKDEYTRLQRKASLNLVAQTLKNKKSTSSDYSRAQSRLLTVDMKSATREESIAYYKNQMLLGEFLKDLNKVESASNQLLKIKGLSQADEKLALQYQLWVAEMRLEFAKAYELSKKVEVKGASEDQIYLKQAIFAELAGKNSEGLYRDFIKSTNSRKDANVVRANLIRKDRNMWPGILAEINKLKNTPDILAALSLEAYSKNKDRKSVEKVLRYTVIQNFPEGRALARSIFLEDFGKFEKKISSHHIASSSDKLLKRTLNERMNLLTESEKWAAQAVKSTDWTLQLLTLNRVANENARLYKTLMNLPVPRALNKKQRAEYMQILSAQAAPFNNKAMAIEDKVDELWTNSAAIDRIQSDIKVAEGPLAKIFETEMKRIAAIASPSMRRDLLESIGQRTQKPSRSAILQARKEVKQNPFDRGLLEDLRELEVKAGGHTMVTYLDARIDSLKGVRQ
jgi:hypothetical protein